MRPPMCLSRPQCVVRLILAVLVCAGCARKESSQYVVGFSQMESDNPYRLAETKSIQDEAAKRGIPPVVTDAQGQTAQQVADVEDLIARRGSPVLPPPPPDEGTAPGPPAAAGGEN